MLLWYREQGVTPVGRRMATEMIAAAESLSEYPEMGRVVPEFNTPTLRELIRQPYRIVYRFDANRIAIIRIWRSERLLKLPADA